MKIRRLTVLLLNIFLIVSVISGCQSIDSSDDNTSKTDVIVDSKKESGSGTEDNIELGTETEEENSGTYDDNSTDSITDNYVGGDISRDEFLRIFYNEVPPYSNSPYAEVNDNVPFFTAEDMTVQGFETYSDLDELGRCGVTYANVCVDTMPTEPRGEIGSIKPSGWHLDKYNDLIDGNYLYNRCHLIAYQLTGENANEKNLITGTRYLNVQGMLEFENRVAEYVKTTENHVLYRVTPIFEGDNLLASGVLMEAYSVEDYGRGICFCVYVYNVQPGIIIDYATGDNCRDDNYVSSEDKKNNVTSDNSYDTTTDEDTNKDNNTEVSTENSVDTDNSDNMEYNYVLNRNSKKFHYPSCSSVGDMKEHNKIYSDETREEIINKGYTPCKRCNP